MSTIKSRTALFLTISAIVIACEAKIATGGEQTITIAENGIDKAVIVVAEDAPPPVGHAAEELAGFLKQITGANFDIVGQAPAGKTRLLIGPQAARLAESGFSTEGLGAEGIVIRTSGNNLILAGGHPRGTLYAVYTFLEDSLGCRWWSSTENTIPRKATIKIDPLNIRYVPVFRGCRIFRRPRRRNDYCGR